jgi:hypothetical protein
MGHDQFLYLTTYVPARDSLLDSLDAFINFLLSNTSWINAVPKTGDRVYSFMSMNIQGGPEDHSLFGQERENTAETYSIVREAHPERIKVSLYGNWLDPYVIGEDLYRDWVVYLSIFKVNGKLVEVELQFGYCNRWFGLLQASPIYFDNMGIVRETLEKGYVLNKGEYISQKSGQSYIPQESVLQTNRLKILDGVAALLINFQPAILILSYFRMDLNPTTRSAVLRHKIDPDYTYPLYPLFYGDPGINIPVKKYDNQFSGYFKYTDQGITINLEKEHFGFLRSKPSSL